MDSNFMNEPIPLKKGDTIKCRSSAECKQIFKAMDKLGIKARMSEDEALTVVVLEDEVISWK